MNQFILFLHFVGLMIGSAGGLGAGIIMRRSLSMPAEQASTVRQLGPMLANVAAVGILLLWITGLVMVWTVYGGPGGLRWEFWVKIVFVIVATVLVGLTHMSYAQIRKGNFAAAKRLPIVGPATGVCVLLAVLFASYAFG
jgi:hypothetical protein